jgi:glc operon protein GlcG
MLRSITAGAAALALTASLQADAQVAEKKSLNLDGARRAIAGAMAEARKLNAPGGVIAVVDDGGNLMALERIDGTFAAGANISIGKARTSVLFKKPTKFFEDLVNKGRTAMAALDGTYGFTPLQGGVPILVDGAVVGGVGVSGAASAQQDEELAIAGAAAVTSHGSGSGGAGAAEDGPRSKTVTYIPKEKVAEAFAKGSPLLETEAYKVHASRREKSGLVEIHEKDTDIIHVLTGTATLVTGGTMVDGKTIGPDEIRGQRIDGGDTRTIVPGDVVVVPAGVPHWFKEVPGPLTYYVVKATR